MRPAGALRLAVLLREAFALVFGFALPVGLAFVCFFAVAMSNLLILDINPHVPRQGRTACTV